MYSRGGKGEKAHGIYAYSNGMRVLRVTKRVGGWEEDERETNTNSDRTRKCVSREVRVSVCSREGKKNAKKRDREI